jgi:hypothetical protein
VQPVAALIVPIPGTTKLHRLDEGLGVFVNHDLAGYEVPVHADIPRQ